MSKYTSEQLKEMAQTFLRDHGTGGDKSFQLIMTISVGTGLAPDVIVTNIEALAGCGE